MTQKIVAPENMGKNLVWNKTTNQYEVTFPTADDTTIATIALDGTNLVITDSQGNKHTGSLASLASVSTDGTIVTGNGTSSSPVTADTSIIASRIADGSTITASGGKLSVSSSVLARITALENAECAEVITNVGSTTVTKAMSTIISTGGTITFPTGLSVGSTFSIIQSGTTAVTVAGASGVTVINPYGGTATLAGDNAVVTALVSASNTVRLFGQTTAS